MKHWESKRTQERFETFNSNKIANDVNLRIGKLKHSNTFIQILQNHKDPILTRTLSISFKSNNHYSSQRNRHKHRIHWSPTNSSAPEKPKKKLLGTTHSIGRILLLWIRIGQAEQLEQLLLNRTATVPANSVCHLLTRLYCTVAGFSRSRFSGSGCGSDQSNARTRIQSSQISPIKRTLKHHSHANCKHMQPMHCSRKKRWCWNIRVYLFQFRHLSCKSHKSR